MGADIRWVLHFSFGNVKRIRPAFGAMAQFWGSLGSLSRLAIAA